MRYGGILFRFLTVGGLTAMALLAFSCAVHAQARGGGGGGGSVMGGGYGGGGGAGGGSSLGSSNGFGNSGNGTFSFAGGSGSSFVGNTANSFVGGSGGSFTGGSGSFSGQSAFSGSSGTGSFGGGGYGGGFRGGSQLGGVSSMNPFASSFANPLASGMASGNTNAAFGTPLFQTLVSTPQNLLSSTTNILGSGGTAGISRGGMGGMGTMGSSSTAQGAGSYGALGVINTNNLPLAGGRGLINGGLTQPLLAGQTLRPVPQTMLGNLQSLLARTDLTPAIQQGISFGLDPNGNVVVRGNVGSATDARTIESLLRFAPGVYGVRSELTFR